MVTLSKELILELDASPIIQGAVQYVVLYSRHENFSPEDMAKVVRTLHKDTGYAVDVLEKYLDLQLKIDSARSPGALALQASTYGMSDDEFFEYRHDCVEVFHQWRLEAGLLEDRVRIGSEESQQDPEEHGFVYEQDEDQLQSLQEEAWRNGRSA